MLATRLKSRSPGRLPRKRLASVWLPGILLIGVILMYIDTGMAADNHGGGPIAIVVHGGAGTIRREELDADKEAALRAALEQAVREGHAVLEQGGTSVEAAIAAVVVLEDSPHFNAGRGAVYNALGGHELDASLMEGAQRQAGAVAAVKGVRNPILLAHKVLTESPHVMLFGEGAEEFGRLHGVRFEDDSYFDTNFRREHWERVRERDPERARRFRIDGQVVVNRRRGGAGPQGQSRRRDVDRRHHEQALGTGGRFAHHRRGHLRRQPFLRRQRHRGGRVFHPGGSGQGYLCPGAVSAQTAGRGRPRRGPW